MILCLDVGNSHIFGGIFVDEKIVLRFRHNTHRDSTSDQLGVFLKNLLRENSIEGHSIKKIAICSVVPSIDYSLRAACKKYFDIEPFMLKAGVKTGIKIKAQNPAEIGADLIAGCVAAVHSYPNKNIIIVDMGTATTLSAISANKDFFGAAILPGLRIAMNSLGSNTAKLFPVEILKPEKVAGRFTTEAIQSGLYYGHLGAIKEIVQRMTDETFAGQRPFLLGTGGFSSLFAEENIFAAIVSDLVLQGLLLAIKINS